MLKIVIPDDFPFQIKGTRALELIKKYNVKLYSSKASSQEEFIQRRKNAEVVVKVISWKTFQPSKERAKEFGVGFVSLEYLLKEADVISIHARLTSQTKNLIGRNEFSLMKPTAIIINTARGATINREALLDALASGKIIGVGLDAFDKEPLLRNDPFLKLNNVTLTPHNAGMTQKTIEKGAQMEVDNIINYL
jgi:phosphoglycerate dehydrogenase-like enzyme